MMDLINTIQHADCFDLMARLEPQSIDLIATDMPYGTTACSWDVRVDFEQWWTAVKRVLKPRGVFLTTASEPFASLLRVSNLDWYRYDWVWEKEQGSNFLDAWRKPYKVHENILVFANVLPIYYPQFTPGEPYTNGKRRGTPVYGDFNDKQELKTHGRLPISIMKFNRDAGLHPTQKPVALYEYLIKTYTQPGDLVLDPFCGSGTTGMAALKTGRRYILGDSSLEYVEAARLRLQNSDPYQDSDKGNGMMQLSLFGQGES